MRVFVYQAPGGDPYENLAAEEWLLDHVGDEDFILSFYQNDPSVIIGKNQNPWVECNLKKMETDGVKLVRRISGGGAVYHDRGNVNFSFITKKENYDVTRHFAWIAKAVASFGIECTFSGRNDLLANGKKFSGNAFASRKDRSMHHGTLLIDGDLEKLQDYLTVDPKKIQSKGIASVRSRVCNLKEICPDLKDEWIKGAIVSALEEEFGFWAEFRFSASEWQEVLSLKEKYKSDAWLFGQTPKFDLDFRERFSWGGVQILFSFERGSVSSVKAYTDAMDTGLAAELERLLAGIPFEDSAIQAALRNSSYPEIQELASCSFLAKA